MVEAEVGLGHQVEADGNLSVFGRGGGATQSAQARVNPEGGGSHVTSPMPLMEKKQRVTFIDRFQRVLALLTPFNRKDSKV